MRLKLSQKVILLILVPSLLFAVVFELAFYNFSRDQIIHNGKDQATETIDLASKELSTPVYFSDVDQIEDIVKHLKEDISFSEVYVLYPDGRIITGGSDQADNYGQILSDDFSLRTISSQDTIAEIERNIVHVSAPIMIAGDLVGRIRADVSLDELGITLENLTYNLIMIGSLMAIISIVVAIFVSRSIAGPIISINRAVQQIARGNYDMFKENLANIGNRDEVGQLASGIRTMAQYIRSANLNLEGLVKKRTEELQKANQQLLVSDQVQKEFMNIAAHELRTPIQPILGMAELLRDRLNENQDKIELEKGELELIIRNAKRLERLSSDILEVSRIEGNKLQLHMEKVNLNDEIRSAIKHAMEIMHESRSEAKIIFEPHVDPIIVSIDKARILEVMSNLLSNAMKFATGSHALILVTSETTLKISAVEGINKDAVIRVIDNGPGIHPEIFDRLFTKFATKSESGTGLGLFISKKIIEAHGGRIWAENAPEGRGAIFGFSLAVSPDEEPTISRSGIEGQMTEHSED
jgi:signal transduction histidine kinase